VELNGFGSVWFKQQTGWRLGTEDLQIIKFVEFGCVWIRKVGHIYRGYAPVESTIILIALPNAPLTRPTWVLMLVNTIAGMEAV
jgi:hypothetical protein